MARYCGGLKLPTQIWEAAAMQNLIQVECLASGCRQRAVYDPHALWGFFWKRQWDDAFAVAQRRFYCRLCSAAAQRRIKRARMTALATSVGEVTHELPYPSEAEWKRFLNRHKG